MTLFKNKMTTLSLVLATLALGACSQCPVTNSHYGEFPYNNIRTAGTGTAIYNDSCAQPVVKKKVTPVAVAAPVVIEKKAEAVFTKKQRK